MDERRTNDATTQRPPEAPMRRTNDDTQVPRTEQPAGGTSQFSWLDTGSASEFERRWHSVQAEFVDDPRRAVGNAGTLIAELMDHVSKNLRGRRGDLDRTQGETDTEVMRQEMRRYKDLVHNLLGKDDVRPVPQPTQPPRTELPRKND